MLEQGGCPQHHNKYTLVSNLCLLFEKLHEVYIDPRLGTLNYWINKAGDKRYWNRLIRSLLHLSKTLPALPENWNRWMQSSRNRTQTNTATPPNFPPRRRKEHNFPSPTPQPRNKVPTT